MRKISWHIAVDVALALAVVAMLAVTFLPAQDVVLASPSTELTIPAGFAVVCTNETSFDTGNVFSGNWDGDVFRSGIDFDTTDIPDTATITKVELTLFINDEYGNGMGNDVGDMTSTAQTYYDANNYSGFWTDVDGNEYLSDSDGFVGKDSHTVELLAAAAQDLEDQLGDDWFSVGWTGTTEVLDKGRDANSYGGDNPPQIIVTYTLPPSPYYLQIVQGAPEKDSPTWWEWIVVNPTDSTITVTEIRVVDNAGFDWQWTADNTNGWPTSGWTDGGVDGYYWSGSETVPDYSAKVFRSCPKAKRDNSADCTMTWSIAVTGFSPLPRETTIVGKKDGSWGGMFYNKPDDTTEQTEAGTYPNGLYAYLDQDTNSDPLNAGQGYTFYVNVHEWSGNGIAAGGTLTITIPGEFTGVALVHYTDFSDANFSGGGESDWTITGTNDLEISNSVDHLSFNATTPTGYDVNTNWELDTRFTGTDDKGETVRYICEANVKVTATLISITVTGGDVHYGTLAVGATEDTTASGVNDTQTATNEGNVDERFQIKSSNAVGGTDWTLGSSQDADTFTHEFSTNGGGSWTAMNVTGTYYDLAASVPAEGYQDFDLRMGMPTSITDYGEHTITVTVLATEA